VAFVTKRQRELRADVQVLLSVYQAIRRHIAEGSNFTNKNIWMNFSVEPRITNLTTIHLLGKKKKSTRHLHINVNFVHLLQR
jgi:hypothetical protein